MSPAYNASKAGVLGLNMAFSAQVADRGIRVNAICPGFVRTPLTALLFEQGMEEYVDSFIEHHQLGRIGEPHEIAAGAGRERPFQDHAPRYSLSVHGMSPIRPSQDAQGAPRIAI